MDGGILNELDNRSAKINVNFFTEYTEVSQVKDESGVSFTFLQVLKKACKHHKGFTVLNKLKWTKSKMLYKA